MGKKKKKLCYSVVVLVYFALCVIVYVKFSSVGAGWFGGGSSSLHSGNEFGRSRTGKGSSGGRKKVVV